MSSSKSDDLPSTKRFTGRYLLAILGCGLASAAFLGACFYLKRHHADTMTLMGVALVYGLVILALTSYCSMMVRRAGRLSPSAAAKRYRLRFMIAMTVYTVALIGALSAVIQYHLTGAAAYVLAITPALPLLAVIVNMGVYLREETDEFERAMQAEAALWASGGLLAIETVWGFMELFDLVPHIEIWWAFPIWCALLAPGNAIARRRYR